MTSIISKYIVARSANGHNQAIGRKSYTGSRSISFGLTINVAAFLIPICSRPFPYPHVPRSITIGSVIARSADSNDISIGGNRDGSARKSPLFSASISDPRRTQMAPVNCQTCTSPAYEPTEYDSRGAPIAIKEKSDERATAEPDCALECGPMIHRPASPVVPFPHLCVSIVEVCAQGKDCSISR